MNLDFSKPRQIYRELFGVEMPSDVEMFVAKICVLWNVKPDNMEVMHFLINGWLKESIADIPHTLELLIATIPQQHQLSLNAFNKTLAGYSNSIEKTFTDETQRRSEQIADAVGVKLEAVLAKSRAPLVANIWLSVVVGFAVCSGTIAVFWIVYRIPEHGWLAVAMACAAVLAQWGKPLCRWLKDLVYSDGEPVGR